MGDRAYIAFGEKGVYDVYYSHWGANGLKLEEQITEDDPFGGEYEEPSYVSVMNSILNEAAEENDSELKGEMTKKRNKKIDEDPIRKNLTIHEVIEELKSGDASTLYLVEYINGEVYIEGYRSVLIEGDLLLYSHPPRLDDSIKNNIRGMKVMSDLIEDEADINAQEILKKKILQNCDSSTNKHVLAASPALDINDYEGNDKCFFDYSGLTRAFKDDKMRIRNLKTVKSWQTVPNINAIKSGLEEISPPFDISNLDSVEVNDDNDERIVRFPIGSRGLSIRGEIYGVIDMPGELLRVYSDWEQSEVNNNNRVYQCCNCGFLTQSTTVGDYNGYSCHNCGRSLNCHTKYSTIRPESEKINSNDNDKDEINTLRDVLKLDSSDVPNSERHLNQIQDSIRGSTTDAELVETARRIVLQYEKAYDTRVGEGQDKERDKGTIFS